MALLVLAIMHLGWPFWVTVGCLILLDTLLD